MQKYPGRPGHIDYDNYTVEAHSAIEGALAYVREVPDPLERLFVINTLEDRLKEERRLAKEENWKREENQAS